MSGFDNESQRDEVPKHRVTFGLDQLKRDNGRCLYDGKPAYAHVMPSGAVAIEWEGRVTISRPYSTDYPLLRNLPRKHLVQLWENTDGRKSVVLWHEDFVPYSSSAGWTLKAQREIEEGEGV